MYKNSSQIVKAKKSFLHYPSKISSEIIEYIGDFVKPGISTLELNSIIENKIYKMNCRPGLKGYKNYPFSSCISVNWEMCHGLPSDQILVEGDIVNIDFVVEKNGWYSDISKTFAVGESVYKYLIQKSENCTMEGISVCGPGVPVIEIARRVKKFCDENNVYVSEEFCGHGTGNSIHCLPKIIYDVNHSDINNNVYLKVGDVITMEPIVCEKKCKAVLGENKWVYYSDNFCYSAVFEKMLIITDNGYDILN